MLTGLARNAFSAPSGVRPSLARQAALHVAFFLAYVLLFRISYIFQISDLRSTPWNPEAGLAVVSGIVLGWSSLPVIFLASLASKLTNPSILTLGWEIVAAVSNALIFAGSAAAMRKFLPSLQTTTTASIVLFIIYAAIVTLASAISRLVIAALALNISPVYLINYTMTLSVGNVVGVLTIVPLFFVASPVRGWIRYFAGFTLFHWISTLAILLTSFIVFGLQDTDKFKFFYLVFLPVLVFAIRDGFMGAAFSILLSDTAMIAILLWRVSEPSIATELQVLMISLSATGLVLGATISERRRISLELEESHARLRDSQAALLQASRLSLASEMAAALAHEINQPLSSIRSFIRAARRKLDKGRVKHAELKSDIDAAVKEVDVAASLIRETRKFLERGDVTKEKLNLRQLLLTCSDLIGPELGASRISWDLRLPEKLPQVMGNAMQIQQVVLNLVRNAKESILEGRGKARNIKLDVSLDSRPGYVEIAVTDSGAGILPEVKAMLFKPLKSSKDNGLGLGLSLSNTIISSHGGDIWYDESVSSGARFAFTLPLSAGLEQAK
ncbi:MAG: MASE1 domain-containing protein [Aestuariivirga sp.]|nr:MASE1 domain-containing protein [Aestuariivirga sp.]